MLKKNADGLYECAICHAGYDNVRQFSLHISCGHKKSSQEYYGEYCREEGEGVCKVCGQPTKFRSLGEGYKDTCSHKCGSILLKRDPAKMAAKKAKTEATCLERYGVTNGGGTKEALEKAQKTNMERRGVAWNMQSREVVEKSKATCMDKYGSTTYVHGAEGTARVEATVMERFGRENFFSGKEGHAAASAGMMAKYGVDNAMHSPEIIERRSAAEREKYGGRLFVQTEGFKEKSRASQEASYGTWYSASPEGRARYREIMLGRHGVPEYFQSEEFKAKSRATLQATRGVDNISQTQEWHDKVAATSMAKYGAIHYAKSQEYKRPAIDKYDAMMAPYGCKISAMHDKQRIEFRCEKCGSTCTEQYQLIEWRTMHRITPCTVCYGKNSSVSVEEKELREFIESLGVEVSHYDRNFLGTYGADIVVESHKVIIEYDGIYWHSELYKDSDYHLEKKLLAQDKGYTLVHVFSDEWIYKRDIVKARLRYLLGAAGLNRVYARECRVAQVGAGECRDFLERNHIQGSVNSRWAYGLYQGKRLLSLMTFGMSRFEKDTVELLRFCSDRDYAVPGAAGKLFSHFVDEHPEVTEMTSYADMRWSTGDAFYTKLGFTLESMSSPGYFIVDGDIRRNRMQFQRHKIAGPGDEGKTEHEITLERGLFRIYDCGQYKYRWTRLTKEA